MRCAHDPPPRKVFMCGVGVPWEALGGPLAPWGVFVGVLWGRLGVRKNAGWSQPQLSTRYIKETLENSNSLQGLVLVWFRHVGGGLVYVASFSTRERPVRILEETGFSPRA